MAGHFALLGHNVSLYNRTLSKLGTLPTQRQIILREALQGVGNVRQVTDNLEEALAGAELIMITTVANAHKELAIKMAPYLRSGQIVLLNPGRTLGAFEFKETLLMHSQENIFVGEAQSLIYACRAEAPGEVRIIGVKDHVLLAAYPAEHTPFLVDTLNSIFPCFEAATNILHTSLENIGAMFHPVVILFNAAAIERGEVFYFYNDMTPAVAGFLEKMDAERLAIGKAFGLKLLSVSEWVSYAYQGIEGDTLCDKMRNNPAYYKILAPTTLNCRMLLEDVPTGIMPMIALANIAGVETPLLRSVLSMTEALLEKNFKPDGRTAENLSLTNVTLDDLIRRTS